MSGFSYTDGSREYSQQYPKSFVSTRAFNNDFFTYTTSINSSFQTVGTLGFVTTTAARCPAGRVLHATGRKIHPSVNPMNTLPGGSSLLTAPKFLVAVYDPISNLSGFIDPTLSMFGKYDQALPNSFDLGPTANTAVYGAAQAATPLGGLAGKLTVSDAGLSASTGNGGTIQAGAAACGIAQINGGGSSALVNISTTACTATSRIFLTGNISARVPSVESVSAGTFQIRTPDTQNVTWLIVN
jgi:hypothetical protein